MRQSLFPHLGVFGTRCQHPYFFLIVPPALGGCHGLYRACRLHFSRYLFPRTNSNGVDLWAMVFLFFLIIPRWEMKPTTTWSAEYASTECCDPCQGAAEICRVFRLQMLVRRRHSVKTQEEQYNGSFTVNITHHTSRSPTSCPCFERRWQIKEQTTTGLGSGGGNSEFSITSKINWRL